MQQQIEVSLSEQSPTDLVKFLPGADTELHWTFLFHPTMQCREFESVLKAPSFFIPMYSTGMLW